MSYVSPHPTPVLYAVIGGSGVYNLQFLSENKTRQYYTIPTPFGDASDTICVADIPHPNDPSKTFPCAFLPRHGRAHALNPSEVNYRANICALKILGVRVVLAINAVGSLDSHYAPGDLTLVSQVVDKTFTRSSTFFEKGCVAHVDFAHPTSELFSSLAFSALKKCFPEAEAVETIVDDLNDKIVVQDTKKWKIHKKATAVTMEGPQFSSKAESLSNKHSLHGHLIGMTSATECKLAREAEMIYVCIAMVTDNDAWSEAPHVNVSAVMEVVKANGEKAQRYPQAILSEWVTAVEESEKNNKKEESLLEKDPASHALQFGIMTKVDQIPAETKERLRPLLIAKYPQYVS
ncbi:5'-methylthioadenosine phosphorylase [Angomonas deanei]|uniref:S-methyl-5'-thioadenosine phosphorylase n=1 Tax=Angomonas deanei TaxID=59799 RepID=S9VLI4_9TRYP|nr:S-methyl-5-thioadenosine phosphorylase [Angomonas deanei]EPY41689.1 5'-methylthioadenosine phosphorylase [Angomonas deanei]CAD2222443.1 Phosphorylase superfamily, putative [Angomonas deanei]|eukprot:EPY41689.1 5'-methylthioadenosine phosphorylase [Angomonas deanei]